MTTVHPENQNHSSSQRDRMRRPGTNNNRKPLQRRDTGYRIGSGGSRRQSASRNINPRVIVVGVVGLLLLISILFGITSCVRGCSGNAQPKEEPKQEEKVNPDDSRVAYGVPSDVTSRISAVLDRNEAFAEIAERADKYSDVRMIDLAINEPEAINFVNHFPDADTSTKPFDGQVVRGEYPQLYTFDERWGYAVYADGIMGITGSGPVALSMASMGLSGKTTYEPTVVAQAISAANAATGATGMDDSFLTSHGNDAGVVATAIESLSDGISAAVNEKAPVIVKLKASSPIGNSAAHWVLVTGANEDGTLKVSDPTSAKASALPWPTNTVAVSADSAYSLAAAAGTTGVNPDGTTATDGTTTDGTTTDGTTTDGTTSELETEETDESLV